MKIKKDVKTKSNSTFFLNKKAHMSLMFEDQIPLPESTIIFIMSS